MRLSVSSSERRNGFALIISISLMAFILLLLLSLSTMVRMETATAEVNNGLQQARQNAVYAVRQAVGDLQKYAGPDQRVTATAAILDTNLNTDAVETVTRAQHWVGVWNAEIPTDGAGDPISVLNNGSLTQYRNLNNRRANSTANNSRFLTWLVSGQHDFDDAEDYTPNDDDDIRLLENKDDDTLSVYAPRVPLKNSEQNVTGGYAYWVADEGVKAKFNIRDSHKEDANNPDERRYSFINAQRSGVENMDFFDAGFPVNEDKLTDMPTADTLANALDDNDLPRDSYHDLTAYSYGLLTDTKHGGLKKDLTWLFEQTSGSALPASLKAVSYFDDSDFGDDTVARVADYPARVNAFSQPSPSWEQLRSFYQIADDDDTEKVTPRPASDSSHRVGPVVVRGLLNVMPEVYENGPDLYFRAHMNFKVVLWNPYNRPLAAHTYEVEFMLANAAAMLQPAFVYDQSVTGNAGDNAQSSSGRYYYPKADVALSGTASDKGITASGTTAEGVFQHPDISTLVEDKDGWNVAGLIFKTPSISFAPGEVRILSVSNADNGFAPEVYEEGYVLTEGEDDGTVYFEYPNPLPANVSQGVAYTDATDPSLNEQRWPKFHWRTWLKTGSGDLNLDSANPVGEIRGFGLREPLADGEDPDERDLLDSDGDPTAARNEYFSRVTMPRLTRVGVNDTAPSDFTNRTSGRIAYEDTAGGRALNTDWVGVNYNQAIQYEVFADPFDMFSSELEGSPFLLRNPLAVEARQDGFDYSADSAYAVTGWSANSRYEPGSKTTIDVNTMTTTPRAYYGRSFSAASGRSELPLADLPGADMPMFSIGYLQHANLYRYNNAPAFPIGNSFPDLRLNSLTDLVRTSDSDYEIDTGTDEELRFASIVDNSYLLNDALWDRFFFSTYETPANINDDTFTPPNARHTRVTPNLGVPNDALTNFFDMAAAYLMVNGAFNVNSTSVEAWKATLSSLSDMDIVPATGATSNSARDRIVSHFSAPEDLSNARNETDMWTGFRSLSDAQLTALAEEMVKQVKRRGPFLSMSEFVNRRLDNDVTGQRGAIQAAIDALDYQADETLNTGATSINGTVGQTFGTSKVTKTSGANALPNDIFLPEASRAHHYAGMPGWVTQGDILQAIGPSLTVRSDTFRIRAYGEAVDPITSQPVGQAWCEAIVQRVPEPVAPAGATADTADYFTPDNEFGRRFEIVSFRWLSPEEI